ncbi:MAG: hypothetical protein RMN51_11805 [Verrucomicrobiota bacterium]|nr:hypothetical protein [Verrucomicrobiota bacterium]
MLAFFVGCKREEAASVPPVSQSLVSSEAPTSVQVTETDIMTAQRSLDYIQGLLARREYEQARQMLAEIEKRPMSAAQRRTVEHLKQQLTQEPTR